jgi:hypothetical protein
MSAPYDRETTQRMANVGLIAAFVVFLWLPTADTFLHLDTAATPQENRAPAAFPVFERSVEGVGKFLAGLEAYFNDHFGFRRRLVRWEQHWKWQLFRDSRANKVIIGEDGWLYYSGALTIDDVLGNRPFSESDLANWHELLAARRDWLAQRGIGYLFVVPPSTCPSGSRQRLAALVAWTSS